jgi:hypothetical protein
MYLLNKCGPESMSVLRECEAEGAKIKNFKKNNKIKNKATSLTAQNMNFVNCTKYSFF